MIYTTKAGFMCTMFYSLQILEYYHSDILSKSHGTLCNIILLCHSKIYRLIPWCTQVDEMVPP